MPETTFHTTFPTSQFLLSRANNGSERGLRSAVSYRFGFNGKENDNEVKWTGNQQDYGMRIYDPRIARFLSADPLIVKGQQYPELTPYQFASNTPIMYIDGLEEGANQNTTKSTDRRITVTVIRDPKSGNRNQTTP